MRGEGAPNPIYEGEDGVIAWMLAGPDAEYAVVVRGGSERFALTVSRLVGQHELVTRPLPPEVADGAALSGAAVLSDGQIALIVDCDAVVDVAISA